MNPDGKATLRDRGDLLRHPFIKKALSSPGFMTSLQVISALLLVTAVARGFALPEPKENLFTTGLFWGLFWPFFIFISTPLFGKLFCAVCPHRLMIFFLGKKVRPDRKPPRWMTSGYISLLLVILFYWFLIYTWPGIFHNPLNSAIYFTLFTVLAVAVSVIYGPAAWCRGLCPVAIPTNIVSRIAFFGIRTYRSKCDSCRRATCFTGREGFEGCPHGLNPSTLKNNSDCTLCMKCINGCSHDAVRFGLVRPMGEFSSERFRSDMPEALGTVLLFGALTFTMQLYNGFYRGPMKESFPLAKVAAAIHPYLDFAVTYEGGVALVTFLFSMIFIFGYYTLFSSLAGRMTRRGTSEMFELFAWTILPVFALSSFAQMAEFFFFRYYPMIADGFLDLLGLETGVRPIVSMRSPWLAVFKLIAIAGAVWSMSFTWRQSGRVSSDKGVRLKMSAPFWLLYLFVLMGFVAHMVIMFFLDTPQMQITGPRG